MAINPLKTFLLPELLKGLTVTARTFFQKEVHAQLSRREDPAVAALPWIARPASLCEWGRALHRLQALRGSVPGRMHHDRFRRGAGRHAPDQRVTTSTCSSASTAVSVRKPARWDAIVLTRIHE